MRGIGELAAAVAFAASLVAAGAAAAEAHWSLEVMVGPGASPGLRVHPPQVDETGRVYVFGREGFVNGVWVWDPASRALSPFLTGSTPLPGIPGGPLPEDVARPLVNGSRALFSVVIDEDAGEEALLAWDPLGGFVVVARTGMDAPGLSGAVLTGLGSAWHNAEGVVSFIAGFERGDGSAGYGSFVRDASGAGHFVLETGDPIPGGPPERSVWSPGLVHVDAAGRWSVVVSENLPDGSDPRPVMLRSDGPGAPLRALRDELYAWLISPFGVAPDGRHFRDHPDGFRVRQLDDSEQVVLPLETSLGWLGGAQVNDPNQPKLGPGGEILFHALLEWGPGGVTPLVDRGLFVLDPDGEGREIIREGDPIPGVPDGRIDFVSGQPFGGAFPAMNARGDVVFLAWFASGLGGVTEDDDLALMVRLRDGRLYTLLREGDAFELAPGDERVVRNITVAWDGGPTEGWYAPLNDRRELAFYVQFTDGSRAAIHARPGECIDLVDDDGDGLVDLDDPACAAGAVVEAPACQNGSDDDLDGGIDFDGGASLFGAPVADPDPQCASAALDREGSCEGIRMAALLPVWAWIARGRRHGRHRPGSG